MKVHRFIYLVISLAINFTDVKILHFSVKQQQDIKESKKYPILLIYYSENPEYYKEVFCLCYVTKWYNNL